MRVALLIGALVLTACSDEPQKELGVLYTKYGYPIGDQTAAFGDGARAIVASATAAEAQRVSAEFGEPADELGPWIPLDAGELAFQASLCRASSRAIASRSRPPSVPPTPGVRIRLRRGADTAMVQICFECEMIQLVAGAEPSAPVLGVGWLDFPLVVPDLVALARRIFPDDPAFHTIDWD